MQNTFFARHLWFVLTLIFILGCLSWVLQMDVFKALETGVGFSDLWQGIGFGMLMALPLPLLSLFAHREWWITRSLTGQELKHLMGVSYLKFWLGLNLLLLLLGGCFIGLPRFVHSSELYAQGLVSLASLFLGLFIVDDRPRQRYQALFVLALLALLFLSPKRIDLVPSVWIMAALFIVAFIEGVSWWLKGNQETFDKTVDIENSLFMSVSPALKLLQKPCVLRYFALARATYLQYLVLLLIASLLTTLLFLFVFPDETRPLFSSSRLLPWLCVASLIMMVPHSYFWRSRQEYLLTRSASLGQVHFANFLAQQIVYWAVVGLGVLLSVSFNLSPLRLQFPFSLLLLFISLAGPWALLAGLIFIALSPVDPLGPLTLLISSPSWSALGLWAFVIWRSWGAFFQRQPGIGALDLPKRVAYVGVACALTLVSLPKLPLLDFIYLRGELPLNAQADLSRALRDQLWAAYEPPDNFPSQVIKQASEPDQALNNQQLTEAYLVQLSNDSWGSKTVQRFAQILINPSALRSAQYNGENQTDSNALRYWQQYVGSPSHQPLVSFVSHHVFLALQQAEQRFNQTQGYAEGLDLAIVYRLLTYSEKASAVYEQLEKRYPHHRIELTAFKAAVAIEKQDQATARIYLGQLKGLNKELLAPLMVSYKALIDQKPRLSLADSYAWKTYYGPSWEQEAESERLLQAKRILVRRSTQGDIHSDLAFLSTQLAPHSFEMLQALAQDIQRLLQRLNAQQLNTVQTGLDLYIRDRAVYDVSLHDYPALVTYVQEEYKRYP